MPERERSIIDKAFDPSPLSDDARTVRYVLTMAQSWGHPIEGDAQWWGEQPLAVHEACYVVAAVIREDYEARPSGTWATPYASARHAMRVHRPAALERADTERIVRELLIVNGNVTRGEERAR